MITPLVGAIDMKPGSATLPFFGIEPVLVDDNNNEIVYIKDVLNNNEIIDNTKILPLYTAMYQAVITITQEIKDYGGVRNILDVSYVDLLDESKTARSKDDINDSFEDEPANFDYTTFVIDENPDFEITKYLW